MLFRSLGSYEKEDYKEINHGNLITLADFYGVSVDYLLCRTENREQINTPLTELHLNDEMVALLKGGRINNRLLCELATHKDFIKFLADIEIYVDGLEDTNLIKKLELDNGLTHSETLMPLIQQLLNECDLTLNNIDLLVSDIGPGSFTGIRIGVISGFCPMPLTAFLTSSAVMNPRLFFILS